jgi:hypothetical protein
MLESVAPSRRVVRHAEPVKSPAASVAGANQLVLDAEEPVQGCAGAAAMDANWFAVLNTPRLMMSVVAPAASAGVHQRSWLPSTS